MLYDLAIIGAGPAGMTCALYALRGNLKVAIIEGSAPGGKMVKTSWVENYPGVKKIDGTELSMIMFDQIQELEVDYQPYFVEKIEKSKDDNFIISTTGESIITKSIFIATGTSERKLGVPGEEEYYGKGISYCAVCDAALYKNKEMIVVGGGNSALEEALYLTSFATKVYLIHRTDKFRADKMVVEKVKKHHKIEMITNTIVTEFVGNGKEIISLKVKNILDNIEKEIPIEIVFPLIGSIPATNFLKDLNILDENNYIIVNEKMETNVKKLYSGGDVVKKSLRQIATAVADGAIAAQEIIHSLNE
ncbi:thioredoxin-disulfide reductase [Mycoplasma sp. (ex Biomphalaria glabrata)]|uniref:thioredoxin-disulfide reductase n=1 Tax=Mycoplasma sp. (ex Biomphalaria glabrata) TaxID=1749074 RepID=UPI000B006462|nr:thioredoxin-disulfide reductase [Mycoplasma sp. (ex Biomphalaria glabrata)]